MNEQMSMQFPEAPKPPIISEQERMEAAQQKYGIYKTLIPGEGDSWYIHDRDGTLLSVEEFKKKEDELYAYQKGERRDIN
jgi:hypothetical protein